MAVSNGLTGLGGTRFAPVDTGLQRSELCGQGGEAPRATLDGIQKRPTVRGTG